MMMDKLREGAQGKVAKIILGLIILSFALAGVGSYLNRPARTAVAAVNGNEISPQTLETAYRNERSRLEAQMGESFNQLADNPEYIKQLRHSVLDRLIDQSLVDAKAHELGLRIGDEQIKQAIVSMPEFQNNGKFDNDRYLQLVRRANMTPEQFRDSIRQDLVRQQLMGALLGSEFVLPGEVTGIDKLYQQSRDVRLVRLAAAKYQEQVQVSDEEIKQYYESHKNNFMNDERVKVDYLLLDAANLGNDIQVSDQDVRDYYDQHQELFQTSERRHVAHILIPFGKDDAAALKKAQDDLAALKGGADFAELAKRDSADTFSAKKGGELDWFEKGVMDPAFEQAAFALAKEGDLSEVVKSQFGYHVIKLLGVEAATTRPFEQVQEETKVRLQKDKAREHYFALQQKMADSSFENPDSLDGTAKALGLKVQSSDYFTRTSAPAPLNDSKVLAAAFSDMLREENTNSDVIEVGDGKALVLHIADYKPKAPKAQDEVRDQVVAAIKQSKASEVARSKAQELLGKLKSGNGSEALTALGLTEESHKAVTRFAQDFDAELLTQLFRMPHPDGKQPSTALVTQGNGDQVIVVLDKVNEADKASGMAQLIKGQLGQSKAQADYKALIQSLRKAAKVEYFAAQEAAVE
ncbi:peptidyl-prolyl cis-trans isomerase D [Aeromonas sp. RU39B]|uniref:peptidylprolyl isomerase n=1 Tax=Aeromonas sp. RU39B TaxID=1907416 RepID=UPI0009543229|nr:peptidylprolyl isomerase [Aeromonas sp. RU39B]SIR35010.1 peptidyl-prolyl cis-trans isomerase D [Aeromonas sp. RU39B]